MIPNLISIELKSVVLSSLTVEPLFSDCPPIEHIHICITLTFALLSVGRDIYITKYHDVNHTPQLLSIPRTMLADPVTPLTGMSVKQLPR